MYEIKLLATDVLAVVPQNMHGALYGSDLHHQRRCANIIRGSRNMGAACR